MGQQSDAFLTSFASQKRGNSPNIARQISENNDWKELLVKITNLRKGFAEATTFLPSYELRQCELQLKELEAQIDAIRAASSAKSRFAFKRSTTALAKATSSNLVPSATPTKVAPNVQHSPPPSQLSISKRRNSLLTVDSLDVKSTGLSAQSSLLLMLTDLESCVVDLLSPSKESSSFTINALHIRGLKRVVLISGYINGSVFLHDCEECTLVLGCQQFRMHTSKNALVQLYVSSRPVIEHCEGIMFAPYYPSLERNDQFPPEPSQHYTVQDFDWIKPTPSPNWTRADANNNALDKVQAAITSGADFAIEELLLDLIPQFQT